MGKTMMGSTSYKGETPLLSPEQRSYLSGSLSPETRGMATEALQGALRPYSPEQYGDFFEKSFVTPAQQQLQRKIIPTIKESMLGPDESGSSALNQALSQSATDLSTSLGQQYMQQYNLGQQRQMQGLGLLQNLLGVRSTQPMLQQRQGLAGPLTGLLGQLGGAGLTGILGG